MKKTKKSAKKQKPSNKENGKNYIPKHEKELGEKPIGKLLLKQTLPALVSFLVMSLYNIVDTIYIGRGVGTEGIGGLTIAFPIQIFIMAVALTFGIGSASIISRRLGEKKRAEAELTFGNFIVISILSGIILTILGSIFITPLLNLFGATPTLLPFAKEYLSVILLGSAFIIFGAGSNHIIRSEGNAVFAMIVMGGSILLNIILDPIFIFTFDMGIRGAAIATVISQIFAAIVAIYYFFAGKSALKLHLKNLVLKVKVVKEILVIGSATFFRQIGGSLMAIVFNHSLAFYGGDLAIAAFGIMFRVLMFSFMPLFSVMHGLQPILGYNYGAKAFDRAKEAIKTSIVWTTVLSTLALIIIFPFAEWVVRVFTIDSGLIALATPGLRIVILASPIIGFQVVAAGMYQTIGKHRPALILSVLRQIVLLIPLILIFPLFFGLVGIWYAFPAADFLAGIITFFMLRKELRLMGTQN